MPQESVATIRAPYDAFNNRDWDTVRRLVADDCEWVNISTGAIRHGGAEVVAGSQQFWGVAFPDLRVDTMNFTAGDTTVVECSAGGTMKGPIEFATPA